MIEDFIEVLTGVVHNSHETIARLSIQAFRVFIEKVGKTFTEKDWDLIIKTFEEIFDQSYPELLVNHNVELAR